MSIKIHAACPVCHETLVYDHEGDGWGVMNIWDHGVVEITAHCGTQIAEHLATHGREQILATQKLRAENYSARVAKSELLLGGVS